MQAGIVIPPIRHQKLEAWHFLHLIAFRYTIHALTPNQSGQKRLSLTHR